MTDKIETPHGHSKGSSGYPSITEAALQWGLSTGQSN